MIFGSKHFETAKDHGKKFRSKLVASFSGIVHSDFNSQFF